MNLVQKLQGAEPHPDNAMLVSFDMMGLYPNVPSLPTFLEFIDTLEQTNIPSSHLGIHYSSETLLATEFLQVQ